MFAGILRRLRSAAASGNLKRGAPGSGWRAGPETEAFGQERQHQAPGPREPEQLSLEELSAALAHEIKEPLSSILGYSQALLSEELAPSVRAGLQMIYSEANRAAGNVHNLLSFGGTSEPLRMPMDITSVIEQALDIKSHDFQAGSIEVARDFSQALPWAAADRQQLLQVFLNLMNNAEHAMRSARGSGHLTVRTAASEDRIRIVFADDGPGIPAGQLERVFEPFFSTKTAGEGTGLGLSISRRIVRRHGGEIWAESSPGRGAAFHIDLPVAGREDLAPG